LHFAQKAAEQEIRFEVCMADIILVVAEQREGKLNRVSLETIAAAQALSKETGWAVEVVLPGDGISALAAELAAKAVARVYALEVSALAAYTSDAYVFALKHFLAEKQPKLVLFPHTYQVRDFAPRLALALDRTLISDAADVSGEVRGRCVICRRASVDGDDSDRDVSRGSGPIL
jgi:electron transfer flavoprotein alpha subunit